jgi:tricorn protease
MKKKYEVMLPDVASSGDLYLVMQWMFSELSVGHYRFGSIGEKRVSMDVVQGGLLGADYEVEFLYSKALFAFKKIS